MADALRESSVGRGAYTDPAGHAGLRAAIARHIGVARTVRAAPEDVLITNGTQQAVDLIARVLIEPGDVAAVEDPGWVPPRVLLETMGARVVRVPVDAEGLAVDALPARTRMVYVSPSHQFPLGVAMSLRRRLELLSWAERTGAAIVEDDYDSEFRYAGRPVEPLHSLDRSGRVLYVGSFSKTLLPTLRLGFCVAPPSLRLPLRKAKFVADWHTTLPVQAALAGYIDQGQFARHIRRTRRIYQARRDRITQTLARDFPDLLDPIPAVAGLHVAAHLRITSADDEAVVDHARRAGVGIYPLDLRVRGLTAPRAHPWLRRHLRRPDRRGPARVASLHRRCRSGPFVTGSPLAQCGLAIPGPPAAYSAVPKMAFSDRLIDGA
jgi:GntR family transcriptional regulator / MocR family aminotransferase